MTTFEKAEHLLQDFKGKSYIHGMDVIGNVGAASPS